MSEFNPMFLIAVPQLGDPNFFHRVIFILHHDSQGAIGLVVNNPLDLNLGDFAKGQKLACHPDLANLKAYCGGPVNPELGWLLHHDNSIEERQEILPGLFVSRSRQTLEKLLASGKNNFRLMLGYAGWGEGQVTKELKEGAWITATVNPKYIFETPPAETWNTILRDMGVDPTRLALGGGFH